MAYIRVGSVDIEIEITQAGIAAFSNITYLESDSPSIVVYSNITYIEVDVPFDGILVTQEIAYVELEVALVNNSVAVTQEISYAELEFLPANDVRVTKEIAYAEIQPNGDIQVSKVLAFLETDGVGETLSQFFTYVEYIGEGLSVTKLVSLVELEYVEVTPDVAVHKRNNAGNRATHTILPDEKTGWALDPEYSWWSVIVPEETENLITNPSFEWYQLIPAYATWQWYSSEVATGYPFATRGANYAKMAPNSANADAHIQYEDLSVSAGWYTWSLDLRAWENQNIFLDIIDEATGNLLKRKQLTIENNGWKRYSISWTESGVALRHLRLRMETLGVLPDFYICTDAWQVENKAYATTYCDGDMIAPNDRAINRSFMWVDQPHNSVSRRLISAEGHGKIISFFDELDFLTTAVIGLGMTDPELLVKKVGNSGIEIYQGAYDKSRDFTVTGRIYAPNMRVLFENRERLINLFRSNRAGRRPQMMLRYQATNSVGVPYGFPLDILCAYKEGMRGNITNDYTENLPLQFHASDPYPQDTLEMGIELSMPAPWDNMGVAYRDRTGTWQPLSAGYAMDASDVIFDAAFDGEGTAVVGGKFDTIGATSADNLAYWDGSYWIQMGDGNIPGDGGPDDEVRVVMKSPISGDIYVAGKFENIGLASTGQVAKWNKSANTFSSVMGFATGGTALAFLIDTEGRLVVGGDFTDVLGDNALCWNTNTGTETVGVAGFNYKVTHLKEHDGYLYVGGDFTQTGAGVDLAFLCRIPEDPDAGYAQNPEYIGWWDLPAAWGTAHILAMEFGADGLLYVLAKELDGITYSQRLRKWDGNSWSDVYSVPTGQSISFLERANTSVDPTDGNIVFSDLYSVVPKYNTGSSGIYKLVNGQFIPIDINSNVAYSGGGTPGQFVATDIYVNGEMLAVYGSGAAFEQFGGRVTTIDYTGNANVFPYIGIYGPCNIYAVQNHTTGGSIWFAHDSIYGDSTKSFVVQANERVYIYLDSGRVRAWSTQRGNMSSHILSSISNLSKMFLQPGENRISLFASNPIGSSETKVFLGWKNKYMGIDSAAVT